MRAWHFIGKTLGDGSPIPADGVWLEHVGPVEMCVAGLRFSLDPFDALSYASGDTLCLVEVEGDVVLGKDKGVCRRRKIVARMDATAMLRYFARMQAISVVDRWDAPQAVLEWLMTGAEQYREEAAAAAWAATPAAEAAWAAWSAGSARSAGSAGSARSAAWASDAAARSAADAVSAQSARVSARAEFNALVEECFENVLTNSKGVK